MRPTQKVKVQATLLKTTQTKKGLGYIFVNEKQVGEYNIKTNYMVFLKNSNITPEPGMLYTLKGTLKTSQRQFEDKKYVSLFINDCDISIGASVEEPPQIYMLSIDANDNLSIYNDLNSITIERDNATEKYILENRSDKSVDEIVRFIHTSKDSLAEFLISGGWYSITDEVCVTFKGYITDIRHVAKKSNRIGFSDLREG